MMDAPDDAEPTVWVCPHCGRSALTRDAFADVACSMAAVECYAEKRGGAWVAVDRTKKRARR